MSRTADLVVAGMGALGGAVALAAARRGLSVVALDPHLPPHTLGSSHGGTRIIREAYFEDPLYVPLVQRAWRQWEELGERRGEMLLRATGGVMIGPPDGVLVSGALLSARTHGLPHERLQAAAARARFPALRLADGEVAVWEPRAGVLFPEACVAAQLADAREAGAALEPGVALLGWQADGAGVRVRTARGEIAAGALVLACGAWLPQLLPAVRDLLQVERVVQAWWAPDDAAAYDPARFPIWIWEFAPGPNPGETRFVYGFPRFEGRIKAARHHAGTIASPDTVAREVSEAERAALHADLAPRLTGLRAGPVRACVCLYTNTPDGHFLLDTLPEAPRVFVASACSGHGFKFAPALGEAIAAWAATDAHPAALARFRWRAGVQPA
ncbi:MAG TPA: N-methyl-L-tryptophan oxidase [Candidatus Eisenbacteria bacterium]|nr:N-methyl-L-tryptophan oxidase [Candidatus Eisenbacteria bacterium]